MISNVLVIKNADAPGGNSVIGTQDLAFSETMSDGNFNLDNMSSTGHLPTNKMASATITITTEILADRLLIALPFTPTSLTWNAYDSDGVPKSTSANGKILNGYVVFDFNDGVSPLTEGDVVSWVALG